EAKLTDTLQKVQAQVDAFRTKKETMKATYTAAQAQTKIGEAVTGISESMNDAGMSVQRAQDKIDSMQARAGAMDELVASGALTDLTNPVDDIQAQLEAASTQSSVDAQLAALKAEVGAGAPVAEVGSGASAPEPAEGAPGEAPEHAS
ncbi:MAG TPA: PspA/IM30 family protein, partial [Acidimicrobiales bacterium]|nr:PspA/IM30 family protein [Acidimicrobiales bacterium]